MTQPQRPYKIWEPLLLSLATLIGMIAGAQFVKSDAQIKPSEPSISNANYNGRQVEEIIRFLETKYVGDVSASELSDKAIKAILDGLDPHTHYFPPDQKNELDEKTSGHYVGIGVEVLFLNDSLVILYPKKDSPAQKAGIKPGDVILSLNGINIPDDSLDHMEVLDMIKGTKGSRLKLKLKSLYEPGTHEVEIIRDEIKVPSILAGYMIDSTTAFIKIARFTNTTYREFMDTWERLYTKEHATDLIIDLRDNPGGYLREAVNILSQLFKEEGKLLVYTEGKNQERMDYKSTGKVFFPVGNVCVLINENSASASEIVAGCLQDQDRAIIIGTKSYGKGLVQEQFNLSNGGVLRMTVSKYYTPSGRLIQKAYDEGSNIDTIALFTTATGRPVHAGGGITPDIIVEDGLDWENSSLKTWMDIISEYAIKEDMQKYNGRMTSLDSVAFVMQDLPEHAMMKTKLFELAKLRAKNNFTALVTYFETHEALMYEVTEATLVAYRTGEEGYYRSFNISDPVVQKARMAVKENISRALAQH